MIAAIIVRLMAPLLVEVIRELLNQLASGQSVEISETSVKQALMARENQIQAQLKSVNWEVGL